VYDITRLDECTTVPQLVQALKLILGNYTDPKNHHGPLTLDARDDTQTGIKALNIPAGSAAVFNGDALGANKWAKVLDEYYVANGDEAEGEDPNPFLWKTTLNDKSGLVEYWVRCQGCSQDGHDPSGEKFDVKLLATGSPNLDCPSIARPFVNVDDVIPYTYDADGNRVASVGSRRWIKFKNVSGKEVPGLSMMVPTTHTTEGTGDATEYIISLTQATDFLHPEVFVTGPAITAVDAIGDCIRAGDDPVEVAFDGTVTAGAMVGPTPSDWTAAEGFPGFTVLAPGTTTGTAVVVRNVNLPVFSAKLNAPLEAGGTATARIWWKTPAEDSGYDVDVADWRPSGAGTLPTGREVSLDFRAQNGTGAFVASGGGGIACIKKGVCTSTISPGGSGTATIDGVSTTVWDYLLKTGETIVSGTKIIVGWIESEEKWYIIAAECPA
jgi:hypothetical protein